MDRVFIAGLLALLVVVALIALGGAVVADLRAKELI